MTNKSNIDLDRNTRLSQYLDDSQELHTRRRSVELINETRCQKKIATTFAEASCVVGEQAGIIFELYPKSSAIGRGIDWTRDA